MALPCTKARSISVFQPARGIPSPRRRGRGRRAVSDNDLVSDDSRVFRVSPGMETPRALNYMALYTASGGSPSLPARRASAREPGGGDDAPNVPRIC